MHSHSTPFLTDGTAFLLCLRYRLGTFFFLLHSYSDCTAMIALSLRFYLRRLHDNEQTKKNSV